jgi:2-polyprenyl-3-methyl-5-hydroxy-6-metoxy-1,4-benzoquinol methylase
MVVTWKIIMPSIEENLRAWEPESTWLQDGNEWSHAWGGPEPEWFGSIYPRIRTFLPAPRILEIAPGFGRWTQFLKNYCEHLAVVDLTAACIEACKKRFQAESHISYHVNDGKSLEMIPDKSLDFVFSFDSMVHVEADVIEAYLDQLAKKLSDNGVGFIHHSNIGMFLDSETGKLSFENTHWRGESMTGKLFEDFCDKANLQCITQELVNWGEADEPRVIDCFSLFTLKTSLWARPNTVIVNDKFVEEAKYIERLSHGYTFKSPAPAPVSD